MVVWHVRSLLIVIVPLRTLLSVSCASKFIFVSWFILFDRRRARHQTLHHGTLRLAMPALMMFVLAVVVGSRLVCRRFVKAVFMVVDAGGVTGRTLGHYWGIQIELVLLVLSDSNDGWFFITHLASGLLFGVLWEVLLAGCVFFERELVESLLFEWINSQVIVINEHRILLYLTEMLF